MAVETRRKSAISKDKDKPMPDIDSKKEKNPAVSTKTRKNLHLLRQDEIIQRTLRNRENFKQRESRESMRH
jgi:hypothetical protein